MNAVDVILLGFVLLFALFGWRMGFVQGLLGFVGFVAGALLAVKLVPAVADGWQPSGILDSVLLIGVVLVSGLIGQGIGAFVGGRIRAVVDWAPVRWLDSLLGACFAGLGAVVCAWAMATMILSLPENPTSDPVRTSSVLAMVDEHVPVGAKQALSEAAGAVSSTGIPIVVGGFTDTPVGRSAPSPSEATTPAVAEALHSVVKVSGNKPGCDAGATGSGYVSTPEHVTTNAHVVAAMPSPRVTTSEGRSYRAVVVGFDPQVDVAVLYVPELPLESIATSTDAAAGTKAAVAGYPGGGELAVGGAMVRATLTSGSALASDIYGRPGPDRSAFVLNATVRPGNSGGPLLAEDGRVIGLVFAQALEDPNVGYALTAEQFRGLSRSVGSASVAVSTGPCVVD